MKRLLVRFGVAVGLLAAPLAMVTGGPAGASQGVLPGVIDVGVSISIPTPVVSPPGTLAMYKVTVTDGPVAVAGSVTVHLPAGSVADGDLTDSSCTNGSDVVTCTFETAQTFTIVATTPAAGTYTVTARADADAPFDALEYENPDPTLDNNNASATIQVKPLPDGVAAGVVKRGHSISLSLSGGRTYLLTVPTTSTNATEQGIVVTIKGEAVGTHTCVGGGCGGDGFNVSFDNSIPGYTWTDFTHPLVSTSAYGISPPCRGIGNACFELGYTDSPLPAAPIVQQPWCVGASDTSRGNNQALAASLCTNDKYKVNGIISFETLMTSTDPIQLPISKVGV